MIILFVDVGVVIIAFNFRYTQNYVIIMIMMLSIMIISVYGVFSTLNRKIPTRIEDEKRTIMKVTRKKDASNIIIIRSI